MQRWRLQHFQLGSTVAASMQVFLKEEVVLVGMVILSSSVCCFTVVGRRNTGGTNLAVHNIA